MNIFINIVRFGAIAGVIGWAAYSVVTPQTPDVNAAAPTLPEPPMKALPAPTSTPTVTSAAIAPPSQTQVSVAAPSTPAFSLPLPKSDALPSPRPTDVANEPRVSVQPIPPSTATLVTTEPADGGRFTIHINSPERAKETVQISYGGGNFVQTLNERGERTWTLDAFAGATEPMLVRFADGTSREVSVAAVDLDAVTKIAILWQAPVNLDLHVFEYAAKPGDPGHIWSKAQASIVQAREIARAGTRARGALTMQEDGAMPGDKLEVYTLYHSPNEQLGSIAFAIDVETRGARAEGATCGRGTHAAVPFTFVVFARNQTIRRESGVLPAIPCGTDITREQRLDTSFLPILRTKP